MPVPPPCTHTTFVPSFIYLKADKHTVYISILAQRCTSKFFAGAMADP